jgi:hypothetical protein
MPKGFSVPLYAEFSARSGDRIGTGACGTSLTVDAVLSDTMTGGATFTRSGSMIGMATSGVIGKGN